MRVLLGVTGGIAAYKAVEILRALQQHDAEVEVILTRSARRFVTPLTFSSLTGKPVHTTLWTPFTPDTPHSPIEHISLAQSIDVFLIAPATANSIAKLAHGAAPDLLSTVYLATPAPTVIAPAMNVAMWQHAATQANVNLLRERGGHIVDPDTGHLACGMTGTGRLAAVEEIVDATLNAITKKDLTDETVLITAGGTREAIDPVRYIGNRSSGRMGHALAAAAEARGARAILITASSLPAPSGADVIRVESTDDMWRAIEAHLPRATMIFAAAAVADFRSRTPSGSKLRRSGPLTLELEPTPDLAARMAAQRSPGALLVAFAAELDNLEQNGRAKLDRKGADAIFANDVSEPGIGFDSEANAGLFLTSQKTVPLPKLNKRILADRLLDETMRLRAAMADVSGSLRDRLLDPGCVLKETHNVGGR